MRCDRVEHQTQTLKQKHFRPGRGGTENEAYSISIQLVEEKGGGHLRKYAGKSTLSKHNSVNGVSA